MHQREVDRIRSEPVHLDATLRLFDPFVLPKEIAPRQRWPRRTDYFAKGELTRLVYEAMRDNGTTAAGELVAAAMATRNIPETDGRTRRDFVASSTRCTTCAVAGPSRRSAPGAACGGSLRNENRGWSRLPLRHGQQLGQVFEGSRVALAKICLGAQRYPNLSEMLSEMREKVIGIRFRSYNPAVLVIVVVCR
jgi:hypothetical protein